MIMKRYFIPIFLLVTVLTGVNLALEAEPNAQPPGEAGDAPQNHAQHVVGGVHDLTNYFQAMQALAPGNNAGAEQTQEEPEEQGQGIEALPDDYNVPTVIGFPNN